MTKLSIPIAALSFVAVVSAAHADPQKLAEEKQCLICHSVDNKIGRATGFKTIAQKYSGKADAEANLVQMIKKGGVGHWGYVPMPPAGWKRPDVSEAEAKELVDWILALH
ncbi:cytochrome c-551 [Sideroxyarcus emersonii]|uniref:Cytochrome c-551 n=1 Tax=Sideroxyarcus emersonii TaxID=2764705 RepID=A0AAN1XAJ1_9PROT|nr:c-type cytochrome [Sideroxyarcus emersonii]BCK87754.1 cytochrome c-551 [Sideroxyarcus emersonii]